MRRSAWPIRIALTVLTSISLGALAAPAQGASAGVADKTDRWATNACRAGTTR